MEFHCILGQWGQNCNIMKNWLVKLLKLYMWIRSGYTSDGLVGERYNNKKLV